MAKKVEFILREEYENWLKENLKSTSSKACYIVLDKYPNNDPNNDPNNEFLYYDVIGKLLCDGEKAYVDKIINNWLENTSDSNKRSYIRKYREFINSYESKKLDYDK